MNESKAMHLNEIISVIKTELKDVISAQDITVSGFVYDSRLVQPGYAFVAIRGETSDGHSFIGQAIEKGAAMIICEQLIDVLPSIPALIVHNSRHAMSHLAAAWYGYPDDRLRLIGVTGTNGKTTTTNLISYLLEKGNMKSGVLGTVGARAGTEKLADPVSASTTPESSELFHYLSDMADKDCKYAVIEVSSHALGQGRVAACNFSAAVFTNLTQDHLDYHGTMEDYLRCKCLLFEALDERDYNRYGVINTDDPAAESFIQSCRCTIWTYGKSANATLRLLNYRSDITGMDFALAYGEKEYNVHIPLIGLFNIYNTMASMCVALAEGLKINDIISWLADAPQVDGRFELINEGQDFAVVVDYAHTPDGLSNLLDAARALHPGRVICLFGCGGNRDNTKRPIMGRIAGQLSDYVIITSDNPRFEDPQAIVDMVVPGVKETGVAYEVELDRVKAIEKAVSHATAGDMIVLAGKGHEDYQIIGAEKIHCDDREIVRELLKKRWHKQY